MNIGAKVEYQGGCWTVRKIKDDGSLLIQGRGYRARAQVSPDAVGPWEPRAKVSAHARTCQCCGRAIHAKTGVISHHGYTRPGDGQQTASCFGAQYLPFEISRDRLGELLEVIKLDIVRNVEWRVELESGNATLRYEQAKRDERGRPMYHGRRQVTEWVSVKPGDERYEKLLQRAFKENTQRTKALNEELEQQTARWQTWKPARKAKSAVENRKGAPL